MALLAPMLLCPLLAFIALAQLTPRYTATGALLYDASEYKVRELQSILRVDPITDAVMASQAEVLRGMPVVEQVASRLNLTPTRNSTQSLRPPSWPRQVQTADPAAAVPPSAPPVRHETGPAGAGSCAQRDADGGAGRAGRHTGEVVARAGGVVHRRKTRSSPPRRSTTRWTST